MDNTAEQQSKDRLEFGITDKKQSIVRDTDGNLLVDAQGKPIISKGIPNCEWSDEARQSLCVGNFEGTIINEEDLEIIGEGIGL